MTTNPELRALYDACFDWDMPRIKTLLGSGMSLTGQVPMLAGDTILHAPCVLMSCEIAEMLIDAGAELNAKSRSGYTPLMTAVFNGEEIVNLLIEKGASLELTNDDGRTALDIAKSARPEIAEIIASAIEARDVQRIKRLSSHAAASASQNLIRSTRPATTVRARPVA